LDFLDPSSGDVSSQRLPGELGEEMAEILGRHAEAFRQFRRVEVFGQAFVDLG
jgi:hypothetical protein